MIELITQYEDVREYCNKIKFMVILNIIPDCFAPMLRGPIKALGIQSKLVIPYFIISGVFSTPLTWFFGFYL
jgi:hypothetical protein